jgi:hypothetical protein
MDQKLLEQWNKHADEAFEKLYPEFVAWFRKHPDYQEGIRPRIAHTCARYQQEYMEAKSYGITEVA